MCPVCIASTAVMAAGVASTAGILAACIGKLSKLFGEASTGQFQNKGEITWQQAKRETGKTERGISQ